MRALIASMVGLLVVAAAVVSCGPRYECDEERLCEFGSVCIAGECVAAACSTSAQCPMEHYCGTDRQCQPGCEYDTDCLPGYGCDTTIVHGTCTPEACVETAVDCGYREFCNTATGDCYDAGDLYCKPCEIDTQVEDCGEGNLCYGGYCGVDCVGGRECPAGFECYPFTDEFGNVVTYQCFTYCWLYEGYEPGDFVVAPESL